MNPTTSIVIRTKNEEKYLEKVLQILKQQTYQDFEIVIVDDHSTDRTLEIAQNYGCKIVSVPKGKFTYPYACNVGVKNSVGRYIVFLSGHSIPINNDWLRNGLSNFRNEDVSGVYSVVSALPNANLLERFLYGTNVIFNKKRTIIDRPEKVGMGVLGFTNAIIDKHLWERYNIDEKFARGGEDTAWARYWVERGFVVIHDKRFRVYHSHNMGPIGQVKQFANWVTLSKPRKFKAQDRNFEVDLEVQKSCSTPSCYFRKAKVSIFSFAKKIFEEENS
ncbi:MAG: glycosyltransferase family A protein [Candidatus Paceibacterota bacterium]|jgi:rhamnosyltransferase